MKSPPDMFHIFTPGDHYSPQCGSSYASVIYHLASAHRVRGGETIVAIKTGTTEGYPPYEVGHLAEVEYLAFPSRNRRACDAISGTLRFERRVKWGCYAPALRSIPEDFGGLLIVHGEPAIVPPLRRLRPLATIVLYRHYDLFRWYGGREVRRITSAADRVICVSRYIEQYVEAKCAQKLANSSVVWNGVDSTEFSPPACRQSGVPESLFVGRMCEEKGPHVLLHAAGELKARRLPFRVKLVGSSYLGRGSPVSDYERRLRALAAPLGEAVTFSAFVDRKDIPGVYRGADIFCAPSTANEPFGLTLVEAMASGLHVVVSDQGAFPEVAGQCGRYFDHRKPGELADQRESLIRDPALRERLGAECRARAEGITWSSGCERLIAATELSQFAPGTAKPAHSDRAGAKA